MRRVDGLDLLRGIAVALVIARHALPDLLPGAGVVGVVMFFALSGYLITGLLLDEHARTGGVRVGAFYARRARRLVPALVVLVAGFTAVTLLLDPLGERAALPRTVAVALTWTGDLPHLTPGGATFHLWTLAVEEQFYLLWPALLLAALARGRVRAAYVGAGAACLLACVATVVWLRADPDLAYALPTVWAGCFVVGGAARRWPVRVPPVVVPPALLGLAALALLPLRGHALTYLLGGPLIAVLTAALVLAWRSWWHVRGPLAALVWLGTVSYGAYLWNYPLALWLRPLGWPGALLAVALTLVAAWASHRWVERPFLHRPEPVRRVGAAGAPAAGPAELSAARGGIVS